MKKIQTVGVVGAGTMGAALAQKFIQEGFHVILADREQAFVEKGENVILHSLKDAVSKKVFTEEAANEFIQRLTCTAELKNLAACDLIVEAIFEDFQAKGDLFSRLNDIARPDTIIATNTSSFSVNELSEKVRDRGRFIGLHYFYHAAKNRLVEIIPGRETRPEVLKAAIQFSDLTGKDAILTKDEYGFAINRFFVPWLNEAVRLLEEGVAGIDEIDAICMSEFGIGMGPFALMNATGIPIALHAQKTLEKLGPSYRVADLLVTQVQKKSNWSCGNPSAVDQIDSKVRELVSGRMKEVVFFVCSQILEQGICTATDLNKGSRIGLKWKKGPVDLMQQEGEEKIRKMVQKYGMRHNEKIPVVKESLWKQEFVLLRKVKGNAIITFNRPEELNALNKTVIAQLENRFEAAEQDPEIHTIFITGSGKAFVAGADIRFFIANIKSGSLENIVAFTKYGQDVFDKIEKSEKKVVMLLNGLTLGGGLELALCGDVILASRKSVMAFPETGIGIYPGLGGTQRSRQRIGKGLAKYLILTGRSLAAGDAMDIGLIDGLVSPEEFLEISEGNLEIPAIYNRDLPAKWKAYADLYEKNNVKTIMNRGTADGKLDQQEMAQLCKTMGYKAPIAMQIAESLIDQGKGPSSELEMLNTIFSTSDALLGLSSIGKKVEYSGK